MRNEQRINNQYAGIMKEMLSWIALVLTSSWCISQQKPSIIFIPADDPGRDDLRVYGNHFNEVPNFDNLADHGLLFTNAYAVAPDSLL